LGAAKEAHVLKLRGRIIKEGAVHGEALVSPEPIGFLGGVDPETGVVVEAGHPLRGQSVAGKILVFPTGKGSTVGSYVLYRLAYKGLAPLGIINAASEAIVAVGAIISNIPMVDGIDIGQIRTGDEVTIEGEWVTVRRVARAGQGAEVE
jgi:predicted aconitase with swiveling domain